MQTKHIDEAVAAVDTAIEKLADMVSVSRQQADAGELAIGVFKTLMTGELTAEGKREIAELAARFSRPAPERKPDFTGGRRPVSPLGMSGTQAAE